MGGKAFKLPNGATFPRMSPTTYGQLKNSLLPVLRNYFRLVATPREAPAKTSFGDLDIVVADPVDEARPLADTMLDIAKSISAAYWNLDHQTTNFALAAQPGDDDYEPTVYRQVDVNVCKDAGSFEQTIFMHSYGDLGMILGYLAKSRGLSLGTKGLRLKTSTAGEFHLTTSPRDIMSFFSLPRAPFDSGFRTREEIFAWIASSPLFHPSLLRQTNDRNYGTPDRVMFQEFRRFVATSVPENTQDECDFVKLALERFDKLDEYKQALIDAEKRLKLKTVLNGTLVMEWSGVGNGPEVGRIIKEVKDLLGEDAIVGMSKEELARVVRKVAGSTA